MLLPLAIAVIAALAAFALTEIVRRNAARLGIVQAPNARSSHAIPTPSGGGAGIVFGGSIATGAAAVSAPSLYGPMLVIALLIAAIGFIDDRRPLSARLRLPAQFVLIGLAIAFAVSLDALAAQIGLPLPPLLVGAAAVIASVYWLNLFNFMDGIDGIAASQAIYMCVAALLLIWLQQPAAGSGETGAVLLGVAAASFGFLLRNWPPAKIFMGDAGSTYLGFMIAMLALASIAAGWLSLPQWLILAAAFVTDATVTLARRLLQRERVFEAHRRHAYQVLSRRWRSHRKVTLGFILVNVVWLLPLAWAAGRWGWLAAFVAYVPLVALAIHFGAGAPEEPTPANA